VATDTQELTDYYYQGNGLLKGIADPSGARTCFERDDQNRLIQSSLVPAPGFAGGAITKATQYVYDAAGQLRDVVQDALGTPHRTHYERDGLSRVKWIDQDVRVGAAPIRTTYTYDDALSPTGVLETPSQIDYPNKRVDRFSQFDRTGLPRSIVL